MFKKLNNIIKNNLDNINNILLKENLNLIEQYIINELIENYTPGKNLTSNNNTIIDNKNLSFDTYQTKHNGGIYILVDFYITNDEGKKDYSEFNTGNVRENLNRISKILSAAYDSVILYLIDNHNKYVDFNKEVKINGISFYPKKSEKDNEKHNFSEESQRTKLYKRFLEQMFGKGDVTISESDGYIYMTFNNIEPVLGSKEFVEQIKTIPYSTEIISAYGKKIK